ncbi:hypothetical protein G7043_10975 [Lentzea sp. NEAU-D13]|uniref:Uncharacterized protein n=1 Tax=Lentzea alba TaxID=2714351 RepID=A0A7C9RP90_9PSEU|nr:hypothetical protein [Lentzea alba]NGY59448.1 hypothetical protein [Lentzea alba]
MDDELLLVPDPAELGLPDELPPIRIPDLATLAQHARASALVAKAQQAAAWFDGREVQVDEYQLSDADVAAASTELGWAGREFLFLVELAEELGFVETTETDLKPVEVVADEPEEEAVETWDRALEFVLVESVWWDGELEAGVDPDLSAAGPAMMFGLFLAAGSGIPRKELPELVRSGLTDEDALAVHDPVPALLDRLRDLGAVEIDDDTVRLTSLALWAMRERYVALGIDIAVLRPAEQMTAEDLLAAGPSLTEEELDTESRAWFALRSPEQAGEELLGATATGDAVERMFAVHLIKSNDLGTERLWRSALDMPEMRPYAKVELPDEEPDVAEMAWLLTDVLAATGEVEESFSSAVPAGREQEIFDAMWRLPHPDVQDVLTMIGEEHPDKKIAKAARKAAFKARS